MAAYGSKSLRAVPRLLARTAWLGPTLAVLCAAGCATNHDQLVEFLRSHEVEVSTGHYVVRPPDVIAFHTPGVEELDGTTQMLRPDGKIVLRLLGEVDVAGLTTEEIASKLKAQLTRYYVAPEVITEVIGYRSQFYYVFGEVNAPGPKLYTGRDTLIKALAEAQPTFLAWRSQIKVLRPAPDRGERKVIVVNLNRILEKGDVTEDILLQEGDVIQVPPTPLAWVGNRIRELLYPVGPVMNAYTLPMGPMDATRDYQDEFGSDDNGTRRRHRSGYSGSSRY
jgi:protein involved in polysaccharide export with SLBB domain